MAQTTFNLAVQSGNNQTGSTGSDSATLASTPSTTSPGTGFNTQGVAESKDIISTISSPIVSSAFIFAGIILLLALVAKLRKNKHSGFKSSLARQHYTTRILGFAAFLMFAAGLGGTISRFMGVEATTELSDITTSGTVNASLVEIGNDYNLYCGTDTITLNGPSTNGYYLFMYANEDGVLPATSAGIANIASAEDWEGLGIGEWGYYVGNASDYTNSIKNPMPLGYSIIDNQDGETEAGGIPVTYCAKISKNVEEANFSTSINYDILVKDVPNIVLSADYNSAGDDDEDGISNREENRYGMNPFSSDSDLDSLNDYDELYTYGTDPLEIDTDEDGLYDYSEIALRNTYGTDPLNPRSNGVDKDGDREYTYSEPNGETTGIPFSITGTGNIPLTYINTVKPGDIDESLGEMTGNAYIFNSAGDITNATITVPYVTETEAENNDITNDTYGSVEVSDDFASADELFAMSITFNEEDEEDGEIPATTDDLTKTVNTTDQTISVNVTDSSSIVLIGNDNAMDSDEFGENYGGLLKKIVSKVKEVAKKIVTKVKTFVTSGAKSRCVSNGDEWDEETFSCNKRVVLPLWTRSNDFKVSPDNDSDSFRKLRNYAVGYDNVTGEKVTMGGHCYGIALLARLLYLDRIDRGTTHDINYQRNGVDYHYQFNLHDKTKDEILGVNFINANTGNQIFTPLGKLLVENATVEDITVRGAIYALQQSQFDSNNAFIEQPEDVLNYFKENVENDPIITSVVSTEINETGQYKGLFVSHAVNLISISENSDHEYDLTTYDSNWTAEGGASQWIMTCTKESCNVKANKTTGSYVEWKVKARYLLDDYYYN